MINLDLVIGISLAVLAVSMFCVLIILIPLGLQLHRTLISAQHLYDTINDDLEPAVKEIKHGVSEIKSTFGKYFSPLTATLNKINIAVVSSAHGVLAGVKTYIDNLKDDKTSYNGK